MKPSDLSPRGEHYRKKYAPVGLLSAKHRQFPLIDDNLGLTSQTIQHWSHEGFVESGYVAAHRGRTYERDMHHATNRRTPSPDTITNRRTPSPDAQTAAESPGMPVTLGAYGDKPLEMRAGSVAASGCYIVIDGVSGGRYEKEKPPQPHPAHHPRRHPPHPPAPAARPPRRTHNREAAVRRAALGAQQRRRRLACHRRASGRAGRGEAGGGGGSAVVARARKQRSSEDRLHYITVHYIILY